MQYEKQPGAPESLQAIFPLRAQGIGAQKPQAGFIGAMRGKSPGSTTAAKNKVVSV